MKTLLPWLILVLMVCSIIAPVAVGYATFHNPTITTEGCIESAGSIYCPREVYIGNITPNEWVGLSLSITNKTGKSNTYTVSCAEPKVELLGNTTSFAIDAGTIKRVPVNLQLTSEVPSGWEFRIHVSNGSTGLASQGINMPNSVDISVTIR